MPRPIATLLACLTALCVVAGIAVFATAGPAALHPGFGGLPGMSLSWPITYGVIGWLITTRRPQNRVGWLLAGIALLLGIDGLVEQLGSYAVYVRVFPGSPLAIWVFHWVWILAFLPLILLLPLLYPTGQLVSPRWRWLLWLNTAVIGLSALVQASAPNLVTPWGVPNPFTLDATRDQLAAVLGVGAFIWLGLGAAALASLVVRLRVAEPDVQQQTKWLAWALGGTLGVWLTYVLVMLSIDPTFGKAPPQLVELGFGLAIHGIAVAIGIGILRYHAFDIDRIINRTIVYTTLTAILAGVLAVSNGLTQRLFLFLLGEESDVATILTTLVVASLFSPIKIRLQALVDHWVKDEPDARTALTVVLDRADATLRDIDPQQLQAQLLALAPAALGAASVAVATIDRPVAAGSLVAPLTPGGTQLIALPLAAGIGFDAVDQLLAARIATTLATAQRRSDISP